MQLRPDQSALLDAVAQFLLSEVQPRIEDKALAFRVLIAANLASVVASELRSDDQRWAAQMAGLRDILPDVDMPVPATRADRPAVLEKLHRVLVAKVREATPAKLDAIRAHVRATLRADLAVASPRFDLAEDIE